MFAVLHRFKKRKILNLTVATLFLSLQLPLGLIGTQQVMAATEDGVSQGSETALTAQTNVNENAVKPDTANKQDTQQPESVPPDQQQAPAATSNTQSNANVPGPNMNKDKEEPKPVQLPSPEAAPSLNVQAIKPENKDKVNKDEKEEKEKKEKITLCHATDSRKNPYVMITVAVSAADGIAGNSGHKPDHFGEHTGPIFSPDLEKHVKWGDIIPPIAGVHAGLNWTTEGRAIFNHNCVTEGEEEHPEADVTLCHATGLTNNPFRKITVTAKVAFKQHFQEHPNDIIPPFEFKGQTHQLNWDDEGKAIFRNNCKVKDHGEKTKVTLCHATGSTTNPFVRITVSAAGAFNGHLGSNHQNGEDIIPPFEFKGQTFSQNWNAAGQAIFRNGCVVPTGGQGGNPGPTPGGSGGQVLGSVTPATAVLGASTLATTGSNTMMSIFIALATIGLVGATAFATRHQKQYS
jgi:hypothetical protein